MEERDFHNFVDGLFVEIEDRLDELELDVDIDSSGGVLTVVMGPRSSFPAREPAAKSGSLPVQVDFTSGRKPMTRTHHGAVAQRVRVWQSW